MKKKFFKILICTIFLMLYPISPVSGLTNSESLNTYTSLDDNFKYSLNVSDNSITVNISHDNTSVFKECKIRFKSAKQIESFIGVTAFGQTLDNYFTVWNDSWGEEWSKNQTLSFEINFTESINNNTLSEFSLVFNYNGVEDEESIGLNNSNYNPSLDDFDIDDGYDELSEEEKETYDSLLEETEEETENDESNSNSIRKIRQNASTVQSVKDITIDLSGIPTSGQAAKDLRKDNLNNYVIQNFYVGSAYVYATSRKSDTTNIMRFKLNSAKTKATFKDYMKICKAGHGQTLDYYPYKNHNYFLIALGSKSYDGNTWSTQVGRVEYKEGEVLDSKNLTRLTQLKSGSSIPGSVHLKRCDAALSTDRSKLLIWERLTKNNEDWTELSIYDFDVINKAWDHAENANMKYVIISRFAKLANFYGQTENYMHSKCQGVELSNIGTNNLYSIYWSIGDECKSNSNSSDFLGIKRYNSAGEFKKDVHILHSNIGYTNNMEMEGLTIPQSGNNIRFLLVPCEQNKKNTQYICHISKDDLKGD